MSQPSDAALVAAVLAGDGAAFAAIYDRYGAALYDVANAMLHDPHDAADAVQEVFLVASQRLGQLREPARLRAWLFSILRHWVYKRSARRARVTPSGEAIEMEIAATPPAEADGGRLQYVELANLVRDAAKGLDERDRLVLELSVRQGLEGADLADALGLTPEQSYSVVFRMRERAERALGSLLVARGNRGECARLDAVLAGWDGTFSVLMRKRVARHIDSCELCSDKRTKVGALALYAAAPPVILPPGLRDRILRRAATTHSPDGDRSSLPWNDHGFPIAALSVSRRRAVLVAIAAATTVLLGALGLTFAVRDRDTTLVAGVSATAGAPSAGPSPGTSAAAPTTEANAPTTAIDAATTTTPAAPSTTAPPATASGTTAPGTTAVPPTTATPPTTAAGGRLTVSTQAIDFGRSGTQARLEFRNDGGRALTWSVTPNAGFLTTDVEAGVLNPASRATVVVTLARSRVAEGAIRATVALESDGGSASVAVTGSHDVAPVVSVRRPSVPGLLTNSSPSCSPTQTSISATVADESAIAAVTLHWSGPGSAPGGSQPMALRSGAWTAPLGRFSTIGTVTYWVTARDSRGNEGRSESSTMPVNRCGS